MAEQDITSEKTEAFARAYAAFIRGGDYPSSGVTLLGKVLATRIAYAVRVGYDAGRAAAAAEAAPFNPFKGAEDPR